MMTRVWMQAVVLAVVGTTACKTNGASSGTDETPSRIADASATEDAAQVGTPDAGAVTPRDAAVVDSGAQWDAAAAVDSGAPRDASMVADGAVMDASTKGDATSPGADGGSVDTCTRYVAPQGDDGQTGTSLAEAWQTPGKATRSAQPGDTICFAAGTYSTFSMQGRSGTAEQPIVFKTVAGQEQQAVFTSNNTNNGTGISLRDVSHVRITGLTSRQCQKGIVCESCNHVRIDGNLVDTVGQEGIHVGRPRTYDGSQQFLGPASTFVTVAGNTVRNTGQVTAHYGEGIYVGTGAFGGDDTHDITVEYNHLYNIKAEAIELKCYTYNLRVRNNLIHDVEHDFGGALVLCAEPMDCQDANYIIENNRIYNVTTRQYAVAAMHIGHGNGTIRHNVIWNVEGGRGIRTLTTFANSTAKTVNIQNNTIWTTGAGSCVALHEGNNGTGANARGEFVLDANLTEDGTAGSTQVAASAFAGPVAGDANAGNGPGSGFRVVDSSLAGSGADLDLVLP